MAVDQQSNGADSRPRYGAVAWVAMVFLSWLVFELTADEALASVVACGKFGWNDWLTARWLRKSDPDLRRGSACSWFYLASAAWKLAVAATAGMFLLAGLEANANAGQAPGREFTLVAIEAIVGFAVAALLSSIACVVGWRSGRRAWVDSTLHASRRQNAWPPVAQGKQNRVPALLTSAILAWLTPLGIAGLIALLPPMNPQRPAPPGGESWFALAVVGGMIGSAFAVLAFREFLLQRVSAQSPRECWPEAYDIVA